MFNPSGLTLLYRLTEAVFVCRSDHALIFQKPGMEPLHVPVKVETLAEALLALARPGISWQGLTSIAAREGNPWMTEALDGSLDLLRRSQMLELVWFSAGLERVVVTALCPTFRFTEIRFVMTPR